MKPQAHMAVLAVAVAALGTTAGCGAGRPATRPAGTAAVGEPSARHSKTSATGANPFAGAKLFVDPESPARKQVAEWRATRAKDAAALERIANEPVAVWFVDTTDLTTYVGPRVKAIRASGALPVLVAYNIPQRDCGSFSAGGARSADAYRAWVKGFAEILGDSSAVVILEPDGITETDCFDAAGMAARFALVKEAVGILTKNATVAVYIDAGNSTWYPAAEVARRLLAAGIQDARGFSLNVSNFNATEAEVAYGKDISRLVGGKPFVVDTSRNGLGATKEWCNPKGRALGQSPTTETKDPAVDAFLWVKYPGESDGTCNGGPPAGEWWADYALGLTSRPGGR